MYDNNSAPMNGGGSSISEEDCRVLAQAFTPEVMDVLSRIVAQHSESEAPEPAMAEAPSAPPSSPYGMAPPPRKPPSALSRF